VQVYTYSKTVNISKLNNEIKSSTISTKLNSITAYELLCEITFEDCLCTEDHGTLNDIVQNHTTAEGLTLYKNLITSAMKFGHYLLIEFAAENVSMGITQANKSKAVLDYLLHVKEALDTGSLYVAISEIDTLVSGGIPIDLDPFVTEARMLAFKQKIVDYLT
jgi:hypothetical protein